uniref:Uncharacterized protein n=1 Tax=Panagrolaimus sp. ES5 TaxID=591445 RepID=A0AC34G085_9BILA
MVPKMRLVLIAGMLMVIMNFVVFLNPKNFLNQHSLNNIFHSLVFHEQIIHRAYCVASLYNSEAASKKTSSNVSPYVSTSSTSPSPINNRDFSAAIAPPSTGPTVTDAVSTPKQNKFYSSMASNSGWKGLKNFFYPKNVTKLC